MTHAVDQIIGSSQPDMLAVARDLLARGFGVIPLDHPAHPAQAGSASAGKTPVVHWKKFQDAKATDHELMGWFGNGRQRNVGIPTGAISGIVVLDGDSDAGLEWMRAHLPPTPMRTKTAKGEHWYYRHPGTAVKNAVRINTGDAAIKVDVRGDGGFVVAAGSLHASGVLYEWIGAPPSIEALPVFDPAWLTSDATPDPAPRAATPLADSIPRGGRNAALFKVGARLRRSGLGETEILGALEVINLRRCQPPLDVQDVAVIAKSCARYEQGQTDFVTHAKGAHAGQVIADHQGNIRLGLRLLGLTLSYNAFAAKALASWQGSTQALDDATVHRAWLQIDEQFHFRPSLKFFEIMVGDLARRDTFHPIRAYLDSLKWDGTSRIDSWLTTYGGAKNTVQNQSYLEAVSAIFLIAAVRRVRMPGVKFDELLICEAPQGTLKSSALRVLCPDDNWFSDDLPLGVDAKQVIERTAGKWIIEASELQGYTNAQVDHLKGMLARQVDGPVRLAYGRIAVEVPRQFIMVGTTNKLTEYLRDSTGNRRFWPVRIAQFDVAALKRDRDQLWAEAAYREAVGDSIRLPESLWAEAALEQDARRQVDPWEELLEQHLGLTGDAIPVEELWLALGDAGKQYKRNDAERLAQIMQRFGYTRKKKIDVAYVHVIRGVPQPATVAQRKWAWLREGTDPSRVEFRKANQQW